MTLQLLQDTQGIFRRLDHVVTASADRKSTGVIKATLYPGYGEPETCEFDIAIWHFALTSSSTFVPCPPGHFLVSVVKDENGSEEVRKDAVVAWRCHLGAMVPATLHIEHDAAIRQGRGGVVLVPDAHCEDLYGANYASLQEYLDLREDYGGNQLTPFPFAMINRDNLDEQTEGPDDPSTID